MSAMSIELSDQAEHDLRASLDSGEFQNASEAIAEGLRLLQSRQEYELEKARHLLRLAEEARQAYQAGDYTEITNAEEMESFFDAVESEAARD